MSCEHELDIEEVIFDNQCPLCGESQGHPKDDDGYIDIFLFWGVF